MNTYKMIGWINNPSLMGIKSDEALADYASIEKKDNVALALLKDKYNVPYGNTEEFDSDEKYIIDEDADGIYLFEKFIKEESILLTFPNVNKEIVYDVLCFDGVAIGQICPIQNDKEDIAKCPSEVKITYPTLEEVLANDDRADEVLTYRGLYDLTKEHIHYGDIMICLGEIQNEL